MTDLPLLLRYALRLLIWIAPVEFLLGRAISRASRQMPAGEVGAAVFGAISNVGTFLVMPAFVLTLLVLGAAALPALRDPQAPAGGALGPRWPRPLAVGLLGFLALSVVLLLPGSSPALLLIYNGAAAALMLGIVGVGLRRGSGSRAWRVTLALIGLAYAGYYAYALTAIGAQGFGLPLGDPSVLVNSLGEAAAMAAGISLLWSSGLLTHRSGGERPRRWWLIVAAAVGLFVLIAANFEQWLQGVATQFSVGFTLFLPVPVTALALAAWVYAALALNSRRAAAVSGLPWAWDFGAGLLLLPAAGYMLQLNYQHLLLAVTLLLLTGLLRPFSSAATVAGAMGNTTTANPPAIIHNPPSEAPL